MLVPSVDQVVGTTAGASDRLLGPKSLGLCNLAGSVAPRLNASTLNPKFSKVDLVFVRELTANLFRERSATDQCHDLCTYTMIGNRKDHRWRPAWRSSRASSLDR